MKRVIIASAALVVLASSTFAQDQRRTDTTRSSQARNTWVTVDGTVQSVESGKVVLNYGPGRVTVELGDLQRDAQMYPLKVGDKIRVTGAIDRDLFQTTTIEANSLYSERLGAFFVAGNVDELTLNIPFMSPVQQAGLTLQGEVVEVNDESFVITSPGGRIEVQVDEMANSPLDSVGYRRLAVGDVVRVNGRLDTEFFDLDPEVKATSVVVYHRRRVG